MSKLFDYSGDGDFLSLGSIYANPKEPSLVLSLGNHADVFFPLRKRSRISAPLVLCEERFEQKRQASIDILPDECLFEVLRRLSEGQERSASACVSKRWLMLLSSIRREEISVSNIPTSLKPEGILIAKDTYESSSSEYKKKNCGDKVETEVEDVEIDGNGYLSRCLEGKKATDVRLAAIAVGTCSRGGLGKLSIRGNNASRGVTNLGLKAISRGCPSLKELSLWNVSSIGDEGLLEIANECHLIEKIDLSRCPAISDKALFAIAKNCPKLTSLTLESCSNVGNEGLKAVGTLCSNLKSVSITNCPLVGDQGIASLLSPSSSVLTKVKLQGLNISDVTLAVIGHYGMNVTDLILVGLENVTEKGFWVMSNGRSLQKLRSITISSCRGITDVGLEALGKGCPNLKHVVLRKCPFTSDNGLVSFAKVAQSLESLRLEECHRISQLGIFGVLLKNGGKLKALALVKCLGIKDSVLSFPLMSFCNALRSLSIHDCPGFGNISLAMLGKLCPQLQQVELCGLNTITDEGLFPLIANSQVGLTKVNLSGCLNLKDGVVSAIAKLHGGSLELLNLDGCGYITDASLVAIAENCLVLTELDVSKCRITDSGIAAMAFTSRLHLQILSISGCGSVSNISFPFLAKLGRSLVGLNIQHCNGISTGMVDRLVEQLWRCDILF